MKNKMDFTFIELRYLRKVLRAYKKDSCMEDHIREQVRLGCILSMDKTIVKLMMKQSDKTKLEAQE